MRVMKRLVFLLSACGGLLCGQSLSAVHTVYLLPMSQGLDQFLANRLTGGRVFQVVTNPKLADAIVTDRIGEAFEAKLADLTANPEPVASAAQKPAAQQSAGAEPNSPPSGSSPFVNPVNKLADLTVNSSFGRGKGMVFLVDPKSHRVLWSAYQPPKDSSSHQLDRAASDIVSRIKRDLKEK